jgi:hypothetical protein
MSDITLKTNHPIAYNSPDHIQATKSGTAYDNSTNLDFITETEKFFKKNFNKNKIKTLDLGCSGGQLTVDFHNKGNLAVGLEGSDYSIKCQRANWPEWYEKILFTCDVTKPYEIYKDNKRVFFDLITAWEVVEHIHPNDLEIFFKYIDNNLEENGIFVASVSTNPDHNDPPIHQSVFSIEEWYNKKFPEVLKNTNLILELYPFHSYVRGDQGSFHICLKKETK